MTPRHKRKVLEAIWADLWSKWEPVWSWDAEALALNRADGTLPSIGSMRIMMEFHRVAAGEVGARKDSRWIGPTSDQEMDWWDDVEDDIARARAHEAAGGEAAYWVRAWGMLCEREESAAQEAAHGWDSMGRQVLAADGRRVQAAVAQEVSDLN